MTVTEATGGGTWSASGTGIITIGASTGIVTGVSVGTAYITYTLPTGCKVDTAVMVLGVPGAGVIMGAGIMCAGASVVLMDSVSGGVWGSSGTMATVSGGVVIGVTAGTDTIKYRVSNICGATTATKPVTVNPVPAAGNITGTDSLCVGNSVALTENVAGGVWSCSNASATVSSAGLVTGVTEGMDTVIYTVSNAWCSADTELLVKVMGLWDCGALGSSNVATSQYANVQIYPNPAMDEITIEGASGAEITIYNMPGQKMMSSKILSDKTIVDIRQLIPGVYVVEVVAASGNVVNKRLVVAQ